MWRLRPELLGDLEYKVDMWMALDGYFRTNWSTTRTRGTEWEALNVVIRGESIGKSYGIRKKLERELTQQEEALTTLQSQETSGDISEADCRMMLAIIGDIWNRLDSYVRQDHRQRLYREGDHSGCILAWLLKRERPVPVIQSLQGQSGRGFWVRCV
ncbi:hypothetical protein NDU88_010292 [Pleurodeles waltl]|uniref:Uncharacterized protein n=1 Tax=Pleurodeles waltl TaxID=8319 RepID=A0AAV7S0X8_PLEWA|nr:hypothetical protein NDU88_010292 [Pleurodeles waltl]